MKQFLQGLQADIRHDMKASVRHEQAIGNQQVQVRVPAAVIAKRLDDRHSNELASPGIKGCFKETVQAAIGALAEPGEQLAIITEVWSKNFRQGEHVLTVRQGGEDRAAQKVAELDYFPGMTARAEPAPFAAEGKQVLVKAVGTEHAGKAFARVAALQVVAHHIIDNRTSIAIRSAKGLLVVSCKCQVVMIEQFPQNRLLRLPGVVNG